MRTEFFFNYCVKMQIHDFIAETISGPEKNKRHLVLV
jgi:hypothetical protein